ncbi:hypothetical protein LTR36_007222 [Oleoguttula mirabilis]|uniref:Pseudouridine synthase I TruA alpha/beta domain-containing protein n=1 Tax=Oleoguttula mirabilis TaxID=1507867 RepID=A0AAV9JA80_9PEZI|nr:hypothetical protein LTR36_007222 [Oleoguttula mirabilis]
MSGPVTPDYNAYTHADLLTRVTELEAQLRALNTRHSSPSPPPKKKPRKPPKPFDPSRYNFRFIALKFAYLGGNYNGFEHHTNNTTPLPTIEEELWKALRKTRLIFPEFRAGQGEEEVCWDGVEYSKCGRTDRGVSAFGQVVGVRVRSSRPKATAEDTNGVGHGRINGALEADSVADSDMLDASAGAQGDHGEGLSEEPTPGPVWDTIRDEHPYIQLLNRVLPPDIRILAWCPHPPPNFSARFSCKERRYRYFFTNPAYACALGSGEGTLDIAAMQQAAEKLEGLHDFRNFCKVDASKQIENFDRRIFHAGVHAVRPESTDDDAVGQNGLVGAPQMPISKSGEPELYYFEVRGSAFLWHQVRHLVAILFLVGQGYEQPEIVDQLLDVQSCPSKPVYEMADDRPLVLWDCVFPDLDKLGAQDHQVDGLHAAGYENALDWVYAGAEAGGRDTAKRSIAGVDDAKYGRNGIMDELWALWRKRKIDEVLAGSLMTVVSRQGGTAKPLSNGAAIASAAPEGVERSDRVFDGSDRPRTVGKYIPIMQRARMETPEVVNARYAVRKGLTPRSAGSGETVDVDE